MADGISYSTNTVGKAMNPIILPKVFYIGMVTGLGEGKL